MNEKSKYVCSQAIAKYENKYIAVDVSGNMYSYDIIENKTELLNNLNSDNGSFICRDILIYQDKCLCTPMNTNKVIMLDLADFTIVREYEFDSRMLFSLPMIKKEKYIYIMFSFSDFSLVRIDTENLNMEKLLDNDELVSVANTEHGYLSLDWFIKNEIIMWAVYNTNKIMCYNILTQKCSIQIEVSTKYLLKASYGCKDTNKIICTLCHEDKVLLVDIVTKKEDIIRIGYEVYLVVWKNGKAYFIPEILDNIKVLDVENNCVSEICIDPGLAIHRLKVNNCYFENQKIMLLTELGIIIVDLITKQYEDCRFLKDNDVITAVKKELLNSKEKNIILDEKNVPLESFIQYLCEK